MIDFSSDQSTLYLTPNTRMARYIRRDYDNWLLSENISVQKSITIMPLQSWLTQVYRQNSHIIGVYKTILTSEQESLIWAKVVEQVPLDVLVFESNSLAQLVQQAWQQCQLWQVSDAQLSGYFDYKSQQLQRWFQAFTEHCKQNAWLTASELPSLLTEHVKRIQAKLPKRIVLANIDQIPPATQALLDALNERVVVHNNADKAPQESLRRYDSTQHEIASMAKWAYETYVQYPEQRIICVVPNLSGMRHELIRVFKESFFPKQRFNPYFSQNVFNISGGYSLASAPIIKSFIRLLQLPLHHLCFNVVMELLHDPFLTDYHCEAELRAQLEPQLRELNQAKITYETLLRQCQGSHFAEAISHYLNIRETLPKKASLSYWCEQFLNLANNMKWPGQRDLTSEEYQQVQKLYQILSEPFFATNTFAELSYYDAVKTVEHLIKNTLFAPESEDGAIEVLGLLEAAGIECDHLWLMQVDDETLPANPAPNPLLPFELQLEYDMPHSSAQRELSVAKQLLSRFTQQAQHVVYSYHAGDGDKSLACTPLLAHLPEQIMRRVEETTRSEQWLSPKPVDLPIPLKQPVVSGGTGLFKSQALCPFQAFARYRLSAFSLLEPDDETDYLLRGQLLHRCLELFWRRISSQAELHQLNLEQRSQYIEQVIAQSMMDLDMDMASAFVTLEQQRLHALLTAWLEIEAERPAFQVVAVEQRQQQQLGSIRFNITVDRIDKLDNDKLLIIDYKSGKNNDIKRWFTERLDEPQLPLYCVAQEQVAGISYAQVNIEATTFKGVSDAELDITGVKTLANRFHYPVPADWQSLVRHWRSHLTALANEFAQGVAEVKPATPQACQYCDLQRLCRIYEH